MNRSQITDSQPLIPGPSWYRCGGKRFIDVVVSAILLLLFMPVFVVICFVSLLCCGCPIFFYQDRPGKHGRLFTIYKFRTMVNVYGPEGDLLPDRERLTALGQFLRASSLDELPELWNVLIGDMSLVGPRPLLREYLPQYSPAQKRRHDIRPGITGLAQVSGRNAISWDEKFQHDINYVETYSFRVDLIILWKTVEAVLSRRGISAVGHATMPQFKSEPLKKNAWPYFNDEQITAVERVLRSGGVNYWTGNECRLFEQEYAASLGVSHAIAVANGTLALELALVSLGIGDGDEVIVPSRTFIATASAVAMRGATPVIADIDSESQNVTEETLLDCVTPKTRAIIVVHLGGWPCEMDSILAFARRRGIPVVEDCAQAHGAKYKGKPVGSFGDINAFSFCQDKIISTGGEGGMVTTNNAALWETAWRYKDHGKNPEKIAESNPSGSFRYLHDSFGTNWRMTEMQAAIGRVQLALLPEWVETRRSHANRLIHALSTCSGLIFPIPRSFCEHSYYRLYGFVKPSWLRPGWSRDRLVKVLLEEGVSVGSGSSGEIYLEKAFDGLRPNRPKPTAQESNARSITFNFHQYTTVDEIDHMIEVSRKVLGKAMYTVAAPAA